MLALLFAATLALAEPTVLDRADVAFGDASMQPITRIAFAD